MLDKFDKRNQKTIQVKSQVKSLISENIWTSVEKMNKMATINHKAKAPNLKNKCTNYQS